MSSMRKAALVGVGLVSAMMYVTAALAADPPDLVGTWKATGDYAAVRLGVANDHHPQYASPSMGKPGEAWTVVIEGQEGRAFHGLAKPPKGGDEPIVGVISYDAEHLLIAGGAAGLFGEIIGDKIEFCYQDHEDDRASVACFLATKE